ncbi:MAG: ATP-binding protein [Dehalobacter sp. 4CP]|uniref:AlbA family DNA-binding domain-containing protein n=1 Tax=Dehalobacter sp. CP TaxID=2594474 RepID=UPI0013CA99D0|nr:ATP-binding protein [Dehalobacter sp. 4CP]
MEKDLYMTISSKTKQLLVKQEGFDADFKMTVKGIQTTDLVAFANSENGGTILVGVGEVEDKNSMQKGRMIGCPVGDKERLFILSKAESCVPPVEVAIIIENYARKPIYRIEIPSGKEKPYCTAGGTYKIRGDGRTNTLLPGRLLTLYIEKQSETFFNRFREATKELGKDIMASDTMLQNALNELRRKVLQIESAIEGNQNSLGKIAAIDKKMDQLLSMQAKGE